MQNKKSMKVRTQEIVNIHVYFKRLNHSANVSAIFILMKNRRYVGPMNYRQI